MPNVADLFALALRYHETGNVQQAEQLYRLVLQQDPSHAATHNNLGMALAHLGRLDEAVVHYRQTLQVEPHSTDAHNNLGTALVSLGKPAEAEPHCREALRFRPDFAEAWNNLGNALQDQRELDASVECYQQALRLKPGFAEACYNMGSTVRECGKFEEAITWFEQAIRLRPNMAFAHNNLGSTLLKLGHLDAAFASFQQALRFQPDLAIAQSNLLFCYNYLPNASPDTVFAAHREWGRRQEVSEVRSPKSDVGRGACDIGHRTSDIGRLRIGYVSPDLRYHALTRYFEPVLAHHDPNQVEVFCYAETVIPDAVTRRLQELAHHWRWTCNFTNAAVAQRIREDRIDILVDLAGHTAGNRLGVFALKPAPIQATWLGYLNTTGLTTVDYRLTDDFLDPPSTLTPGPYDTEEPWRLPAGMCCFAPPADAPPVTALPALSKGGVTFGSLHSLFKLNTHVFDLWSRVLLAIPEARLLIYRDTLTAMVGDGIGREFSNRGIARERLDLRQGQDAPGYLAVYGEIDVGLDTFPCSGGVTTCESLWMGVPVLTLCSVRPAGRHSAAILSRVGLTEWLTHTAEEYVTLAVRHAQDLPRLAQLRNELRERMVSTLCDSARFTRTLEEAYRTMWRRWCDSQKE